MNVSEEHTTATRVQTTHNNKVQRGIDIFILTTSQCYRRNWEAYGRKRERKRKTKSNKKNFVYLLQFPLFGLGATCSFLPFSHIIPLSSRGERCAVLPVHRQLQLQQVEG